MRLRQESMRVEGRDLQAIIFSIKGIDQRRYRGEQILLATTSSIGRVGSRPRLEAVSRSHSSGMVNSFAPPFLRAQPVRPPPVRPQSARVACSAFSPDVDADGCRWGDG